LGAKRVVPKKHTKIGHCLEQGSRRDVKEVNEEEAEFRYVVQRTRRKEFGTEEVIIGRSG